jgi:hypothetical protein
MLDTLKLPLLILHEDKVMLIIKDTGAPDIQAVHEGNYQVKDLCNTANIS